MGTLEHRVNVENKPHGCKFDIYSTRFVVLTFLQVVLMAQAIFWPVNCSTFLSKELMPTHSSHPSVVLRTWPMLPSNTKQTRYSNHSLTGMHGIQIVSFCSGHRKVVCPIVKNQDQGSGFTGLFYTKDHCAITLVKQYQQVAPQTLFYNVKMLIYV